MTIKKSKAYNQIFVVVVVECVFLWMLLIFKKNSSLLCEEKSKFFFWNKKIYVCTQFVTSVQKVKSKRLDDQ